ncbi:MAG: hypothetical protein KC729_01470 [Candidatus Eisenbacteria bacterium]|uniref:PEGA domain-containing protein n=1 Tax=Eiseniibacteriota bacterium TaxID=2212470 RepID=A0A956LXG5_UNCEI|nr:hypothetical protein [Candidatus Eisenbacteria bacterium]
MCTNTTRESRGLIALLVAFLVSGPVIGEAAQLRVESSDGPRRVWVDRRFVGLTPVEADSLTAGRVRVEVGEPDSSDVWVLPYATEIEITESVMRTVVAPPLQRVRVLTPPLSTELRIDGTRIGNTPLQLLLPADRTASFELRAAGMEPRTLRYRAGAASDTTLQISLAIAGPGRIREESGPGWFSRSATLLPIGAVLAGAAGVWSRQTADRAYDEYLHTVDRSRMKKNLDRANRYDDVAIGFWIAAEALLAASVWTWLRVGVSDPQGDVAHPEGRVGIALDKVLVGEAP